MGKNSNPKIQANFKLQRSADILVRSKLLGSDYDTS